jgi:hypothetical protein
VCETKHNHERRREIQAGEFFERPKAKYIGLSRIEKKFAEFTVEEGTWVVGDGEKQDMVST